MAKAKLTETRVATLDIDEICQWVADGRSLNSIAREVKRSESTIRTWIGADPERAAKYAGAREDRAHMYAEQIVGIADDIEADPQRSRLQVDARKWVASKLMPRVYGDRLEVDNKVSFADLSDEQLHARFARLLAAGAEATGAATVGRDRAASET